MYIPCFVCKNIFIVPLRISQKFLSTFRAVTSIPMGIGCLVEASVFWANYLNWRIGIFINHFGVIVFVNVNFCSLANKNFKIKRSTRPVFFSFTLRAPVLFVDVITRYLEKAPVLIAYNVEFFFIIFQMLVRV